MASVTLTYFVSYILISVFAISSAQMCSNNTFSSNRVFSSCIDLPYLEAHLHWNYTTTGIASIAFRAAQTSNGWIAWAINPTATGMVGSQALVAFRNDNGSMEAYTTSVWSYNPSMRPMELSFQVWNVSAEYSDEEMIIFADIGLLQNGSVYNHVWQTGNLVLGNVPQIHPTSPPHLQSMARLDFLA